MVSHSCAFSRRSAAGTSSISSPSSTFWIAVRQGNSRSLWPTAIEQGFDVEAYTWNAFFVPKGTPEAIIQKLNHATVEAMKTPAVREKLESAGLIFVSDDRTTPEYLAKFVQSEIVKWAAPIKAGHISVD